MVLYAYMTLWSLDQLELKLNTTSFQIKAKSYLVLIARLPGGPNGKLKKTVQ